MPDPCSTGRCGEGRPGAPPPSRPLIVRSGELPGVRVDMPGADGATIRELITHREGAPHFAMRLFHIAPGGHTPLHTHPYEHEVFILDGEGELTAEDGPRPLRRGDAVYVPASAVHQFRNTAPKPLAFLCMIPNPPA